MLYQIVLQGGFMSQTIELINKETGQKELCMIRTLSIKEMGKVLDLQEFIGDELGNKEIFYKHHRAEIFRFMRHGGYAIGVFNSKKELIAYRIISRPRESKENLGRDIGLKGQELMNVLHLESVAVKPDYRGNGLELLTYEFAREYIENFDQMHLFYAVFPKNVISLKNMFSKSFMVVNIKNMHRIGDRTFLRFILYKGPNDDYKRFYENYTSLWNQTNKGELSEDLYAGILFKDENSDDLHFIETISLWLHDTSGHMEALDNDYKGILINGEKIIYVSIQDIIFSN